MADFAKTYVTTNLKSGAPEYDEQIILDLKKGLIDAAPELEDIVYAVFASLAIGAHRPDIIPRIFELGIDGKDEESIKTLLDQLKGVLMVSWAFVGIPWCVPACLGLVNVLKLRGMEKLAEGRTMPDISPDTKMEGKRLLDKTYHGVQNAEVREMLGTYFADFSSLTWTVIFGYSLAGTTAKEVFKEHETQLMVAAAICASGATRQARSHGKAAMGLGNSPEAVKAVYSAAERLNDWNGSPVSTIDVETLKVELQEALSKIP